MGRVKEGTLWKESHGLRHRWQRRHFDLHEGGVLSYFLNDKATEPRGTLQVAGGEVVSCKTPRVRPGGGWVWRLNLETHAGFTAHSKYVLAGESVEESLAWIDALHSQGARVGLALLVHGATAVPRPLLDADVLKPCLRLEVVNGGADGSALCAARSDRRRSQAGSGNAPVWEELLILPSESARLPPSAVLRLTVRDQDAMRPDHFDYIGEATISVADLLRRHTRTLLVTDRAGEPVTHGTPAVPCELTVGIETRWAPPSWPRPSPSPHAAATYPRHVLMLTRGTRGDVQPFVALARGFASRLGWLVTLCTELRWRSWVLAQAANLPRGAIRFLPSGGDTARQMDGWAARQLITSRTELLQALMLAFSEANFFGSAPVFVHHARKLQAGRHPLDLLVCGFTVTGAALLASELLSLPLVPFILQPTAIPSTDPEWRCVEEIQASDSLALVSKLEATFTSHATLSTFKQLTEGNTLTHGLPKLRVAFGLPGRSPTWPTLMRHNCPVVIPIRPSVFNRPADWPSRFVATDFIFLRSAEAGGGALSEPIEEFLAAARQAGRRLCAVTFSSMPVGRRQVIDCAIAMIDHGRHPLSVVVVGPQFADEPPPQPTSQPTSPSADSNPKAPSPSRQPSRASSYAAGRAHGHRRSISGSSLGAQLRADVLRAEGKLLLLGQCDFGVLFDRVDCFVVHGGLGTTVEALRRRKPVAVTGILLMDQRWWGRVCERLGVGPAPVHLSDFRRAPCVDFVDKALEDGSEWRRRSEGIDWGDVAEDGVAVNVTHFEGLLEEGLAAEAMHSVRQRVPSDRDTLSRDASDEADADADEDDELNGVAAPAPTRRPSKSLLSRLSRLSSIPSPSRQPSR